MAISMDKQLSKLFYVDIFDGVVKEGEFIENDQDGLWIRVKGEYINTFVYSDTIEARIFEERDLAETGLAKIRADLKAKLLENNLFIKDICKRLEQHEGKLYVGVIREILEGK